MKEAPILPLPLICCFVTFLVVKLILETVSILASVKGCISRERCAQKEDHRTVIRDSYDEEPNLGNPPRKGEESVRGDEGCDSVGRSPLWRLPIVRFCSR